MARTIRIQSPMMLRASPQSNVRVLVTHRSFPPKSVIIAPPQFPQNGSVTSPSVRPAAHRAGNQAGSLPEKHAFNRPPPRRPVVVPFWSSQALPQHRRVLGTVMYGLRLIRLAISRIADLRRMLLKPLDRTLITSKSAFRSIRTGP
jgi:hypothetical protein